MKERMDIAAAGDDRNRAAGFQEPGVLHPQMADAKMRGDGLRVFEVKMRVDARPFEDVEGPGKLVLMNVRRPFEPKQNLDVKPRVVVDDELRLAESRLRLKRLLIVAFLFEIGFALLVVPWSAFWDRNYFAEAVPVIHTVITNNFVRGAVSGLGVINLASGLSELIAIFLARNTDTDAAPLQGFRG